MNNNVLIDNIRALCKKNRISISKLESDLFLSPGLISRWTKSTPTVDKVMSIARYFGITVDELIGLSEDTSENEDIERFLTLLYNRSLTAETNWEIWDFQNPPEEIPDPMSLNFFSNKSCDSSYTEYIDGYFFLSAAHAPSGDLLLSMSILPDIYSSPYHIPCRMNKLIPIYEYLNRRFSKRLNQIKSINLMNAYTQDSNARLEEIDPSSSEKITPLRNVNNASSY